MTPEILFLKQEDVIRAGALDMPLILELAEQSLRMWARDELINPTKVGMVLPDAEHEESFFISMPVYIGGSTNIAGFKWAAESRYNITQPDLPTGVDITILSDPKTVLPVAIMDATLITAMRTAASAGIGAKYLARSNTRRAAFVGAGIIGRTMIMAMRCALPQLETIELYDLSQEKARALADEFADGPCSVRAVPDLEKAVREADLVVTMTSTRKPFLQDSWLRKDATVIQMGPNDVLPEVILNAQTRIMDNWKQLTGSKLSAVHLLSEQGLLTEDMMTELRYVVNGDRPGRRSEEERVVYCSLGLGAMDILIANRLYQNARKQGIGQTLTLWDSPKWV